MIIKSRKQLPLLNADADMVLPVLPIRSSVIFPGETHTFQVGRKENLTLFKEISKSDNLLVLSFAPRHKQSTGQSSLSQVGILARVESVQQSMAKSKMVTVHGLRRIALLKIQRKTPYIKAVISEVEDISGEKLRLNEECQSVLDSVKQLVKLDSRYTNEIEYTLAMNKSAPGPFADRAAATIHFNLAGKQEILEAVDVSERVETLIRLLKAEVENMSLLAHISTRATESIEKKRREVFLRQQLMEIRRELGEEFAEEDRSRQYHRRIKDNKAIPREIAHRLLLEANRLKSLSSSSNEYGSSQVFLDLMLDLPWEKSQAEDYDMSAVEKTIEEHYYGSPHVKEQILEYLAVRQTSRALRDTRILCLSGPGGSGKASLAKAIALSTGRKFVRLNGTSLLLVEDIKGVNRSEVGAGPGQIIRAIKSEGSYDLVVYLEDLEFIIESEDNNALLSLLEAIDPRHNYNFIDNFVGFPIDFSRIIFILGASYIEDIPEPFGHRLEMVDMPGYIEREKIAISLRHLLPKLYKRHGLTRGELKFSEKSLTKIIRYYTMEAGLISLQQQLEKIFRKTARKKASCEDCNFSLTETNVEQFLGTPQFIPEKAVSEPEIGVATGLAWTGAGGDLMLIEGLKMRGTGQVIYTGSLGEVMKESVQAAHSFVRARAETLGIDHDDFVNYDIHIHFPMGAIPKDGPSAGVTVSLVVASVMAERPIRNDIAMTGEVTLRGKVLSVGGVKEKIAAAYRAGINTIILPRENDKDIKNLPREITRKTKFIFIETVDELFEHGLLDFTPSSYTLEKLFAQEIEKARKRGKGRGKGKGKAANEASGRKPARKVRKKTGKSIA